MKADISAYTFRAQDHFSAVVVGQGQVILDSDLNEQAEIGRHRTETTAVDVIGTSGVPKELGGFGVSVSPDGSDLLVDSGRMYVDGILCENEPTGVGATVVSQDASSCVMAVANAANDGIPFAVGQWVDVLAAATTRAKITAVGVGDELTLNTPVAGAAVGGRVRVTAVTSLRHQPDRFTFDPFAAGPDQVTAGAYRVELDVWRRHLSTVEDPAIREVALGDADSSTRVRTVWQLRLVASGAVGAGSCATAIQPAKATLAASTVPGLPSDEPCVLPDEAGYRGLENQLYRVEVHSATDTQVVLKWQRDNASTASVVLAPLGSTLRLADIGRDDERGFATAPFVEVTDDFLELEQLPSDLIAVTDNSEATQGLLGLASAPALAQLARNARARRWDGVITIDLTSATAGDPVLLERGVQVALGTGALRPGDYWMIPARTANSAGGGTIVWPQADNGDPIPQPPQGIRHHTGSLAVVDTSNLTFLTAPTNLRECRTLFPPLTGISASDVSVDPTPCGFGGGVKTVQDAIDALCDSGDGCCTATAVPGPGWESVFGKIAAGADGQICFPVGDYPTPNTVSVSGKGHLVLHGLAAASVLDGTGTGPVVSFSSCAGITIDSMAVVTADNASGGALTFTQCGDVVVRDCRFTSGAAAAKQNACVSATGGTVRVSTSTFAIGNLQTGLIAINSARTVVDNCRFQPVALPASTTSSAITTATKQERIQARRLLVAGLTPTAASGQRVGVTIGKQVMSFGTPPAVKPVWAATIAASYDTMKLFQKALDKLLRSVFAGNASPSAAAMASFVADRIISRRTAVISQAIVVAGQTVGDVLVQDNDIASAIQGVHVGTSHRGQPRIGPADVTGRVTINRNKIAALVPADGARARHAVFVGNADRLRLTENDVSFIDLCEGDPVPSDGVRIYGFLGRAITVRDNVVDGFPGGITLNLFQARGGGQATLSRMWAVEDNLVSGAATPITLAGPLKGFVKFRGNKPGPADN